MLDWTALEATIRRDPAGRGLASFNDADGPLLRGHLENAARDLAERGCRVALVTGFAILTDAGPVAETDGPPGSLFFAAMLQACGIDVCLVTDQLGEPLVRAGMAAWSVDAVPMLIAPPVVNDAVGRVAIDAWWQRITRESREFSHLVAIERVGPSHTLSSLDENARSEFAAVVPPQERDVCHNMRGRSLDACTAPLHRLFETEASTSSTTSSTIGIVDGGNEIGCGNVPWQVLRRALAQGVASRDHAATIPCRIQTNHAILAGVSNWGAYALGAAVAFLLGKQSHLEDWTIDTQRRLIEAIVADGGAVDGVTKRREATVDGLALSDYLAVFDEIRRIALT